jgi:signal transduction histidine kinase
MATVTDSLEKVLQFSMPDSTRIQVMGDLCFAYRASNADKAKYFGKEALKLSLKTNNLKGIAQSYNDLGILFFDEGNYPKAIEYYNESLKIRQKLGDEKGIAAIYNKLGILHQTKGEFKEALGFQFKALKIYEAISFDYGTSYCLNNIAIIYYNLNKYDESLKFHKQSLSIKEKINDQSGISGSLSNIGNIYFSQKNYSEAISHFKKAEKIQREREEIYYLASTLNNLGSCYKNLENYKEALKYITESYTIRLKLNDKVGQTSCLLNTAQIQMLRNQFGSAIEMLHKGLSIAHELGAKDELENYYENLSEAYKATGEHKKALSYFKLRNAYRDSIYSEENNKQIAEMQTKYDTEKKEQQIELLTREKKINEIVNERKQNTLLLSSAGLGLAVVLVLIILFMYRQKETANKRLILLDKEKNEFLGIAAHDLKNPLQTIIGFCQMQADYFDKLSKEKILKYSQNIEISARRMIELINNLLDINAIEQGRIKGNPEFFDMYEQVSKTLSNFDYAAKQKNIQFVLTRKNSLTITTDRYMFAQVFENLMSNALKYSPTNKKIFVDLFSDQMTAGFSIKDEGPGMNTEDKKKMFGKFTRLSARPTGGETSNGLGLSIVKKLTDLMGGNIICQSELGDGCCFIVRFPITTAV